MLVTDRGYIYVPPNLAPGNVNFTEWCEANDIRLLHPYNEGEGAFTYDAANNVFLWNPDEVDEVRQDLRPWLYQLLVGLGVQITSPISLIFTHPIGCR